MNRDTARRPADAAILEALTAGPLTTREISSTIIAKIRTEWSERHGYDFEWETDQEPVGARVLAHGEARDNGLLLLGYEIDPRMRRLEKLGDVVRIQVDGHRPMLWRLA